MSITAKSEESILHRLAAETRADGEAFRTLRNTSCKELAERRFPTPRDEDWRFLDLKPISRGGFHPLDQVSVPELPSLEAHYIPESMHSRLVFVNGVYQESLSATDGVPDSVVIGSLAQHHEHPMVEKWLNQLAIYPKDPFTSFNGSVLEDGGFVYIPKGVRIEAPIHVLNLYTEADKPYFAAPRLLFVAEEGARATVVEEHNGLGENAYLTVPVSEFKVHGGAHIHHVRIQRDSMQAVHVSRPATYIEKKGEYHSYTITFGGKLTRNEPLVVQEDEEVDFTLDGLVLIDGEQISDTHSVMDHRFSHGQSHQLHKVVVKGAAHSIFNGKIFVRKDAQKIDSFQENRNLLLSREGLVNTKPQLEIFADDVLCSHGATIGQLDPEHVFYLQSRGMTEQKAKEVLTYAFALETIENVNVESVHKLLVEEVKRYTSTELTQEMMA
ncbi:MAG: Fe-S cluster assembly protein SufD [Balneolaceae bacterium]